MTAAQRQRVRELFELALERPAGPQRQAWIEREAGDAVVSADVLSLLAHHDAAGSFLTAPALEGAQDLLDEGTRFQVGDRVGRFRVIRELGRGGMGVVYLATDSTLGRDVALKVLSRAYVHDPRQRQRLSLEARAAARVRHPGICTIYALETIDNEVVIESEFVDGHRLRDEIRDGRRPSPSELVQTTRALALALDAAHAGGVIHRDLKPENVMRTADGLLKILDFGVAKMSDPTGAERSPRVTSPGTLVGTPAYMAPEQIGHEAVDARTDLFALGVLLFEYATGHHPFESASAMGVWARVLEGHPSALQPLRPDLPAPIVHVIERCLRRVPGERWASARDLVEALDGPGTPEPRGLAALAEAGDPPRGAFWWRTHMVVLIALYLVTTFAAWSAFEWLHGLAGPAFVVVAMVATVGGVYRGHLLFSHRQHDAAAFRRELRRARAALDAVDLLLAAVLVAEGLRMSAVRPVRGAFIGALGLGIGLARLVLERSTTQATFGEL